jgi:hypothetical protein
VTGAFTHFLGAFTTLQKVTIGFVTPARPMGQLGFHWTDFHEI